MRSDVHPAEPVSEKNSSPSIKAELFIWKLDAFSTLGVGCAFLLNLLLMRTQFSFICTYVDPGIAIILAVILIKEPLEMIFDSLCSLVLFAPDQEIKEKVSEACEGILTRSNSEARIGSNLEAIGLPYRNDDLVEIIAGPDGARPFRDTYFADFKVPNLNGGITIHEHLGAFQMDDYSTNALKRLNDYHNFTVYELPGRRVEGNEFTWSFEGDLRNQEKIDQVIRRMLLPGLSL